MMNITYIISDGLYVNLTNRCPCDCIFCIRNNGEGAYGSESLWLEKDPTPEQVIEDLKKYNLSDFSEVVYCGYGEPTEALESLIKSAEYIRSVSDVTIRINTNGLSDIINKKPTAKLLTGLLDIVSISLNAGCKEEYLRVTRPSFGEESFDAMLAFAKESKDIFPKVMFTLVDVISEEEIKKAQELSDLLGIELRVRKYTD